MIQEVMKLRQNLRAILCAFGLCAFFVVNAADSAAPPPSAPPKYSAADLEKLVAPIALHPDPLIAILLPASVYPLEIVQAARFVKDTNNIPKLDGQSWDDNVKALAKFPAVLQMMNEDISWTMDLGQAFVNQQKELMDTIQMLRGKASSSGVLKTTPQQVIVVTNTVTERTIEQKVVYVTNTVVQIQPSNPQVIYVPTYPPTIYYPPPVYAGPPPIVSFAAGIAVGAIIANNCDWHGGGVYVGPHGAAVWGGGNYSGHGGVNINGDVNINTGNINTGNVNSGNRSRVNSSSATSQKWQPDQSRMSSSGAKANAQSAQSRGWSSGASQPTAASSAAPRPSTGAASSAAPRPSAGAAPSAASSAARPSSSSAASRPSPSSSQSSNRPSPSPSRESAFGGVSSGASPGQSSSRGASSRSGGGGGGRSGGGGRGRGR